MFFKKKRLIEEQVRTIATLNEKLSEKQQQLDNVNAQLEELRQREYAISRVMTEAAETANRIISDAQKESDDIHDSAQQEYISSQKKGEEMIQTAYENARDIIRDAEQTSEKKIKETDEAVCAYVKLLNQFNESMKEQARQAEENVKKLCDYYARLNSALPELFAEVPLLNNTLEEKKEKPLPDPEGDPAQLMHNIYTIQNRYLLHEDMPDRTSVPEEDEAQRANVSEGEASECSEEREMPQFEPEEETVVKVSDIISEDVGTIDTEELISKAASAPEHLPDESD